MRPPNPPSAMLSKKYRLPIGEFNKNSGRQTETKHSGQFTLKRKRSELPFSRFGIIIGKKVHAHAAKRNSLKRKVLRFLSEHELYKRPGYDNLILIAPPYLGLTREALFV